MNSGDGGRSVLRLRRHIPLSAFVAGALFAAIWLSLQLRSYEVFAGRTDMDGTGLTRSSQFKVACHYLSVTGRESFLRVYGSPAPRDAYACPRLRKRGDQPLVLALDE